MPIVILKPPCARCGRTDRPVWLTEPPLCDRCHALAEAALVKTIAADMLSTLRAALADTATVDGLATTPGVYA